jgi:hypothetical protein
MIKVPILYLPLSAPCLQQCLHLYSAGHHVRKVLPGHPLLLQLLHLVLHLVDARDAAKATCWDPSLGFRGRVFLRV